MDSQKSEQLTENEQIKTNIINLKNNSTIKMDLEADIIETTTSTTDTNIESIHNIAAASDDLNTKDLEITETPMAAINVVKDDINEISVEEDDLLDKAEVAEEAIEYNLIKNFIEENKNVDPELEHTGEVEKENIENIDTELIEDVNKNGLTDSGDGIEKDPKSKIEIKIDEEIKTNINSEESKLEKNIKSDTNNEKLINIKSSSDENLKNDATDGNSINKMKNIPDQKVNDNNTTSDKLSSSIASTSKFDPKFIQYFDNILLSSPQHKLLLNNEDLSSFSDSNIDIPSKNLKRIKSKLQPTQSSSSAALTIDSTTQIKTGVKKSYSCIGKFNQDSDDFYCKIDEKSQQKLKKDEKKSNKISDDLSENSYNSDNQLSSSPSSSTSSSESSKNKNILRNKTDLTVTVLNNIKQRPKSTPSTSIPKTISISSTSPIVVEKKPTVVDTTNIESGSSNGGAPILKRESFIRQSFNKLFRKNSNATTFSNASSSNSSNSSNSSSNSEKSNNNQNNNNSGGGGGSSSVERFLNSIIGGNISINSNNNNSDKSKNNQKSDINDDFDEIYDDDKKSMDFKEYIHGSNQEQVNKRIKLFNDIDKNNKIKKSINEQKCSIKIRIDKVPSESDLSKLTNERKHNAGIRKNNSFIVNTKRSTNNVNIGIRSTTDSQMAPLQGQSETNGQSIINLSTLNKNHNHYQSSNNLNQNNSNSNQNINNYNNSNNNNINANNLNTSNSNLNSGSNNLKTDTKSQKQISSSPIASSSETKQQQQSPIITTTTTSSSSGGSGQQQQQLQSTHSNYQQQQSQERPARSISPHPIKSQSTSSVLSVINDTKNNSSVTVAKNDIPEKEKKRKELSSSRKKKFHRHFQQVSKDERVLNYFSCALVSDILLQGHLYITENYFAFYSNVFGFVTKLLIPTSSVVKISKEKTAKIIPNAVGVATIDERHVFGSFMSREAAFRLMCSVCPPLEATESIVISPKIPVDGAEICEEYSVEDDSSCSISGNESPAQLKAGDSGGGGGSNNNTITSGNNCGNSSSDASHTLRHRAIPIIKNTVQIASNDSIIDNDLLSGDIENGKGKIQLIIGAGTPIKVLKTNQTLPIKTTEKSTIGFPLLSSPDKSITSTTTTAFTTSSSSPSFKKVKDKLYSLIHFKFPTEVHVVYIGIFLAIILTIFSLYLMYRILDIEAKASYRSTIDISNKWSSRNDDDNNNDIYAEALKWQKELQAKSTEEAQNILSNNLELIARVRKSLKALSMLIHDRHVSSTNYDTQYGKSIITEHDDEIIS